MAQFDLYRNLNPRTRAEVPLLLDVQSALLNELASRVVIPLYLARNTRLPSLSTLTPTLRIEGEDYLMMTPQLAGVARKDLGAQAGNLAEQRPIILAALDLLLTGY